MISIGFSTNKKNWVSTLIRKVTGSRLYSHTWIAYHHPLYRMDMIVEAASHGIIERPYHHCAPYMDNRVELVPPEGVVLGSALPTVGESLGTRYDYGSVIGRLWVYLCRWFGQKVKNPLGNARLDSCVENVIRYLDAERLLPNGMDPETASPEELYGVLLKAGWRPVEREPEKDVHG